MGDSIKTQTFKLDHLAQQPCGTNITNITSENDLMVLNPSDTICNVGVNTLVSTHEERIRVNGPDHILRVFDECGDLVVEIDNCGEVDLGYGYEDVSDASKAFWETVANLNPFVTARLKASSPKHFSDIHNFKARKLLVN